MKLSKNCHQKKKEKLSLKFLKAVEYIAWHTNKSNLLYIYCKSFDKLGNITTGNIRSICDSAFKICIDRYGKLVDEHLEWARKSFQNQRSVKFRVIDPSRPLENQLEKSEDQSRKS